MMAFLWGFIRPYAFKIAIGLAAVITVLAVLARFKHAGRLQERVEAQERTVELVKRKNELQRKTKANLRKSGDSAVDRMRRDWQRD